MAAENITLTEEQINLLFKFVEKKFVKEYDLQVELVDHLACRTEDLMTSDPSISFDRSSEKVYADFGLFGFAKLVKERTRAASENGRRLWLHEFKQLWQWPEVAIVTAIAGILYLCQFWILPAAMGLIILGLIVFVNLVTMIAKNPRKKLLVGLKFAHGMFSFSSGLSVNMMFQLWLNRDFLNEWGQSYPFVGLAFCLFTVLFYITLIKVYHKMIATFKIQYPEAFA